MKNVRLYQNTVLTLDEELTLDEYASHHLKCCGFHKVKISPYSMAMG
ncbi:hypothetical protein SPBRAN_1348 [uncultured Candidatus Thioglobus sp.]|nr:hypothetical protein SPBRAN_1348 [uncultured Candidatus Thioglobus sp.]